MILRFEQNGEGRRIRAVFTTSSARDEFVDEYAGLTSIKRRRASFSPTPEPFAAADVASLRVRIELARAHVLEHAPAKWGDGIGTHRNSSE
jgi:hypothetical protein